jgi:hypothetical protein
MFDVPITTADWLLDSGQEPIRADHLIISVLTVVVFILFLDLEGLIEAQSCLIAFYAHNATVFGFVPRGRLLVFEGCSSSYIIFEGHTSNIYARYVSTVYDR